MGISSAIGWNAILSDFSFFNFFDAMYLPDYLIPILYFFLNFCFQLFVVYFKMNIKYRSQLIWSLVSTGFLLISIPFAVIYLSSIFGYLIICFIILLLGLANAILLNSIYGILSYLPANFSYWTQFGQNISGILTNLLRFSVSLIMGTEYDLPRDKIRENMMKVGIAFFVTSGFLALINVILIIVNLLLNKVKVFIQKRILQISFSKYK